MAEKKVTIMVLKVDLQCEKCYKKVKKVLCKFPQIRDQKYDEKANTVTITVVCCSPEKIRDKICRKGCGVIKSIEILPPPKPKEEPKPKPKEEPKKKEEKKEEPKEGPKSTPKETPKDKEEPKPLRKEEPKPPPPILVPPPAIGYPSIFPMVGYERPAPCYDGCGCGCGGSRWQSSSGSGYSDQYYYEENPQTCRIM